MKQELQEVERALLALRTAQENREAADLQAARAHSAQHAAETRLKNANDKLLEAAPELARLAAPSVGMLAEE